MLDFERVVESYLREEERIKKHLASDKLVYRKVCSEVSQTANIGTDEQELNRRHLEEVKVARTVPFFGSKPKAKVHFLDIDSAEINKSERTLPIEVPQKCGKSAEVLVARGWEAYEQSTELYNVESFVLENRRIREVLL